MLIIKKLVDMWKCTYSSIALIVTLRRAIFTKPKLNLASSHGNKPTYTQNVQNVFTPKRVPKSILLRFVSSIWLLFFIYTTKNIATF